MSFKDDLEARRRSANAAFHRFRTMPKAPENIYFFLEGYEDCAFYRAVASAVPTLRDHTIRDIICFGKKNMDRVIQMFYASSFTSLTVLFIRDSDFDRFLGIAPVGEHVLLTDGYSVENYVCGAEACKRFILEKFAVDVDEFDVGNLVEVHLEILRRVFIHLAPFIGAALHAIKAGRQLSLDSLNIKELYKLVRDDAVPIINAGLGCGLYDNDFNEDSARLGAAFVEQEPLLWLRGKYALECTALFLSETFAMLTEMSRRGEILRFNRNLSTDFSPRSMMERLTLVSPIPETVIGALERLAA